MKARPAVVRERRKATARVGRPPIAPGSPGGTERDDLALPHERDESLSGQTHPPGQGQTPDVMRQAYDDIVSGQVDTDLRATPGLDARRRRALLRRR